MFAILDLGFEPRHALIDDSSALRLVRILEELTSAQYSIHDISRVELSGSLRMPRFNMPFEAGIAYALHDQSKGAARHHLLLLDSVAYQHHASLSDVAGLDTRIHGAKPGAVIFAVRTFLCAKSRQPLLLGGTLVIQRYLLFQALLRKQARSKKLDISLKDLRSWDYVNALQEVMRSWIIGNTAR